MVWLAACVAALAACMGVRCAEGMKVTASRLSTRPMIDASMSSFDYTYNPASFVGADGRHFLLTRVQDYNATQGPYAVGTVWNVGCFCVALSPCGC